MTGGMYLLFLSTKVETRIAVNISNIHLLCKIMEYVINSSLMSHLNGKNILSGDQYGFRENRSCEVPLLRRCTKIEQFDSILLDFSKAFDLVTTHSV